MNDLMIIQPLKTQGDLRRLEMEQFIAINCVCMQCIISKHLFKTCPLFS